jgi:hypothetical protein
MITSIEQLAFEKNALLEVTRDKIREYGVSNFCRRYGRDNTFVSSRITGNRDTSFETILELYGQVQELFSNRSEK